MAFILRATGTMVGLAFATGYLLSDYFSKNEKEELR